MSLYVDALIGRGFPTMTLAVEATKQGLARFTGNQWNEAWEWDRKALESQPEASVKALYETVSGMKP